MLKKNIYIALAVIMVFSMVACGNTGESASDNSSPSNEQSYDFAMGTGNVGGTWYPVGGAIAAAMSNAEGASITAQASAGGTENIRMIASGDRELGLASTNLITWAEQGIEFFKDEKIDSIRSIAVCMPQAFHYVVRANAGIDDVTDLKGKRVGTGAPGSGESIFAPAIIEIAGVGEDEYTQEMLSFSEQVTAFKDRQIDSMFMNTPPPSAAVMDAASQADITLLSFSDELIGKIGATAPYYYKCTISKDSYDFLTEDVQTVGIMSCIICHKDLPDDVVYNITKALFENVETVQATHASVSDFSLETALIGNTCKLHPGALKYYEEIGVEIPEACR